MICTEQLGCPLDWYQAGIERERVNGLDAKSAEVGMLRIDEKVVGMRHDGARNPQHQ